MVAPVYRSVKGQALTSAEGDENLRAMYEHDDGIIVPKEANKGVLIDPSNPDFGWHDMLAEYKKNGISDPTQALFIGNIYGDRFAVGDNVDSRFHIPHDYLMGSPLYIHAHWAHNSASVTTGSVTFQFEATYSKGHNQAAYHIPIVVTAVQAASTIRYQHMVAEELASAAAGAGGLMVTEDIEVDGIIKVNTKVTANTMDGGALPFIDFIDIHYQSTGLPTKNRAPDFWT